MPPMAATIPTLREAIDVIDHQIVELIAKRLELVRQVGDIKKAEGRPVYDPTRERDLLDKVARAAPHPLHPEAAQRIFERIIEESRSYEQRHISTPPGPAHQ